MSRYAHLIERIQDKMPNTILEVGTWNGERARAMLNAAPGAYYFGFDLFEQATKETDERELNVKKHFPLDFVLNRLSGYNVVLVRGDTRETLPRFAKMATKPIEFAWIDGGHSVETIRSDWEAIKPMLAKDAEVWFDDYYSGGPDITRVGCNAVVADLKHEVHDERDPVATGGFAQMVRVFPE